MKRLELAMVVPVLVLALLAGSPGLAADSESESTSTGVIGPWDRRAEVRRVAHDQFDFNEIARRALGQHWEGLVPGEHEEFLRLFASMMEQSLSTLLEQHSREHVALSSQAVTGAYAQVRSRIVPDQGPEVSVETRWFHSGSRWVVYDVLFDGVSLVSNYRSQFNSIIRTSSFPQLLERMRTEQSRRMQSRGAVEGPTDHELESLIPERLAAGLLLSAAVYGRRQ
jgi:phospholipid transport system substrate-binding protein